MLDKVENPHDPIRAVADHALVVLLARLVSVVGVPIALYFFFNSLGTLNELQRAVDKGMAKIEAIADSHERRLNRLEDDVRNIRRGDVR